MGVDPIVGRTHPYARGKEHTLRVLNNNPALPHHYNQPPIARYQHYHIRKLATLQIPKRPNEETTPDCYDSFSSKENLKSLYL